jgi:hypothetical protein
MSDDASMRDIYHLPAKNYQIHVNFVSTMKISLSKKLV